MRSPSMLGLVACLAAVGQLACVETISGSLHDPTFVRELRAGACTTVNKTILVEPLDPITSLARPELSTGVQLTSLDAHQADLIVTPDDRRSILATNIREVRVTNHARGARDGFTYGALAGVALGALLGYQVATDKQSLVHGPEFGIEVGLGVVVLGTLLGGAVGGLTGGIDVYRVIPERD